jgi:hypothetical protein
LTIALRCTLTYVGTFEKYFPVIGIVKAGNAIEERCFTGTIGPDESDYFTAINGKRNIFIGLQAAKIFSDIIDN